MEMIRSSESVRAEQRGEVAVADNLRSSYSTDSTGAGCTLQTELGRMMNRSDTSIGNYLSIQSSEEQNFHSNLYLMHHILVVLAHRSLAEPDTEHSLELARSPIELEGIGSVPEDNLSREDYLGDSERIRCRSWHSRPVEDTAVAEGNILALVAVVAGIHCNLVGHNCNHHFGRDIVLNATNPSQRSLYSVSKWDINAENKQFQENGDHF